MANEIEHDGSASAEPLRVRMLEEETLKSFWEFATTVRRTQSLAHRESVKLRGSWISPNLVVQRVHGWGIRSVRLLCVSASTEEQCQRLRVFFHRDRRNLEGRLVHTVDPLDREPRVLVKIPFESGLDGWVKHERQVLQDLGGIVGVAKSGRTLYFEDIDVHAATYEYVDGPSLQENLEKGLIVPQEHTHSILSRLLTTLKDAHALGWLHTDLGAKDIIMSSESGGKPALICGWSRAVHCRESSDPGASLVEFARSLQVQTFSDIGNECKSSDIAETSVAGGDETSTCEPKIFQEDLGEGFASGREVAAPSIYAAPEQFLGLFAGVPCVTPATDVYRAAAITLMATCGTAPLGVQGKPVDRNSAPQIDALRRLCRQAIQRRAECGEKDSFPQKSEVVAFADSLEKLVSGHVNLSACKAPELAAWFSHALTRESAARIQTPSDALEKLDSAWSEYELRLANEYKAMEQRIPSEKEEPKRNRIVFEPPPELAEMTVL